MRNVVNWAIHWKDDNDCPAKVKVVNWEETEEHVTEEHPPFPVNHERCNRHCMRPHPGWNSLVLEKFEVLLKKPATTVEVVPDNETFRLDPGAVKKSSRAVIFLVAVGQTVFLLRASLQDEEGSVWEC